MLAYVIKKAWLVGHAFFIKILKALIYYRSLMMLSLVLPSVVSGIEAAAAFT